jgi:vacuolar iron transporter family protein
VVGPPRRTRRRPVEPCFLTGVHMVVARPRVCLRRARAREATSAAQGDDPSRIREERRCRSFREPAELAPAVGTTRRRGLRWTATWPSGTSGQAVSKAARAAVLGINDGLVTNISLILGVLGATDMPGVVQLAGLASLVAGACSMAVGEYVSVRAQVELLERLLVEERQAIRTNPERERALLQDTMQRHGFHEATARAAIKELAGDPERALAVYARAVLGVNPEELGSPWTSALSSLLTFAFGALVPLLPWFITAGSSAVVSSLVLAAGAAVAIGGLLGKLTDGRWMRSALRQLLVVTIASAITFLIGRLFGTTVS